MSRSILLPLVSILILAVGCISVKTPDVSVDVMDPVNAYKRNDSSKGAEPAPAQKLRYTPYASTLERVNRQQIRVAEEFTKRDWADTEKEAQDWAKDVRRLNGYASVSNNPEQYRTLASKLLDAVQSVGKNAARARDAEMCSKALDSADAILNQFSEAFPLTEPADKPVEPQPSRTTKAP